MIENLTLRCDQLGSLQVKGVGMRNIVLEPILSTLSSRAKESREKGLSIATEINNQFGEIILPADKRKLAYNHMYAGEIMRHLNSQINPDEESFSGEENELYGTIGGCGINMIFLVDAVMDEQQPSPEFVDLLLDGCLECVKSPDSFFKYSFPDEIKYHKAKTAFAYAYYAGCALQNLGQWAVSHNKEKEYEESKTGFLASAEALVETAKASDILQQDPYLSSNEYNYVREGKSTNIVSCGINLFIPMTEQATQAKKTLLDIWTKAQDVYRIQLLDDIEDLKEDLPMYLSVSSYLTDQRIRDEFIGLVEQARSLRDGNDELWAIKRRMIGILWQTGILPNIFAEFKNVGAYISFLNWVAEKMSGIKGYQKTKVETMTILLSLAIVQLLAAHYVEFQIKRGIRSKGRSEVREGP